MELSMDGLLEMQLLFKVEEIKEKYNKLSEEDKLDMLDEGEILTSTLSTIKQKILNAASGALEKTKMLSFIDHLIKEQDKIPSDPKQAESHIKKKIKASGANIALTSKWHKKILKGLLVSGGLLNIINPFAWALAVIIALVTESKGEAFGGRIYRMVTAHWRIANRQQDKDSSGGKLIWWSVITLVAVTISVIGIISFGALGASGTAIYGLATGLNLILRIISLPTIYYGIKVLSEGQYASVALSAKDISDAKAIDNQIEAATESTPGSKTRNI